MQAVFLNKEQNYKITNRGISGAMHEYDVTTPRRDAVMTDRPQPPQPLLGDNQSPMGTHLLHLPTRDACKPLVGAERVVLSCPRPPNGPLQPHTSYRVLFSRTAWWSRTGCPGIVRSVRVFQSDPLEGNHAMIVDAVAHLGSS